jgi:hypothetical protein
MSLIRCVGYTDIYIIFSIFREPLFVRGGANEGADLLEVLNLY